MTSCSYNGAGATNAYLADDVPVGEADNHPVLGCVVLILVLNDQALASKEVSLALCQTQKS